MEEPNAERLGRELARRLGGPGSVQVHAGTFLVAATALTLLNVARDPADLWSWRFLGWWGALLTLHAVATAAVALHRARSPLRLGGQTAQTDRRLATWSRVPPTASLPSSDRLRALVGGVATWLSSRRIGWPAGNDVSVPRAPWGRATAVRPTPGWPTAAAPARQARWPTLGASRLPDTLRTRTDSALAHGRRLLASASSLVDRVRGGGRTSTWAAAWPAPAPPNRSDDGLAGRAAGRNGAAHRLEPNPAPVAGGSTDLVPPAIAALWTTPTVAWELSEQTWPDARSTPETNGRTPPPVPASARPPRGGRAQVRLVGPDPIADDGSQWPWLEAAATAWLARREADLSAVPTAGTGGNGQRPPDAAAGSGH